jgi:hypothetical protein
MQKRLEDQASGRIKIAPPSVEPFHLPRPAHPRSRPVAIDAAVCFLATALGSLSPQALDILDLAPSKAVLGHVDPESGKFTDRILIGGLQSLSWNEAVAAKPAFTKVSAPAGAAESAASAPPAPVVSPPRAAPVPPAKPVRELAQRRPEKAPEPKVATAAPPPAPVPAAAPVAEPKAVLDAVAEAKPATASEHGVLSALAPTALTSRLAPVGEKMINGARAIGGAVTSGLAWIGY